MWQLKSIAWLIYFKTLQHVLLSDKNELQNNIYNFISYKNTYLYM